MKPSKAGILAFDTETDSLDALQANIVGLSLATAAGKAAYVPLGHMSGMAICSAAGWLTGRSSSKTRLAILKPVLEHPAVLKIGQNIKYDWHIMNQLGDHHHPVR